MRAQKIKLNLIPGGVIPVVYVSQYDVGRPLEFALYDGPAVATLEAGTVIDIRATKPDGTGFEYACTWSGNVASIATQAQMTVLSGSIECELHLVKDEQEIGTANFILEVEAAALRGDTDISETELPDIIDSARSSAAAAAASESNAEAYAVGKRGGVDVTSGDPAYENNSKYYSESAGDSATAAATSKSDAEAYAVGKRGGVDVTSGDPAYENNSKYYAEAAADSESAAGDSATAAATSESNAEAYAIGKRGGVNVTSGDPAYENNSKYYSESAGDSATAAATSKSDAEAYAVGKRGGVDVPSTDPTYNHNSKYYSEVAQQAAAGGIIPKGTTTFAQLPALADSQVGDMWNISDDYVTTSDFREGAGVRYGAGSNVYKTGDGKWDVTSGQMIMMQGATANAAGTPGSVTAPAAGQQNHFWTGGGNWKLNTADLITNFTSSDNANETGFITSAGGETAMSAMTGGDTHHNLFVGLSKAVLNTRKLINSVKLLWKVVGNQWAPGEFVKVGFYRLYNGQRYRCLQTHTTSASILPTNGTYWIAETINQDLYTVNEEVKNLKVISNEYSSLGALKTAIEALTLEQRERSFITDRSDIIYRPYRQSISDYVYVTIFYNGGAETHRYIRKGSNVVEDVPIFYNGQNGAPQTLTDPGNWKLYYFK